MRVFAYIDGFNLYHSIASDDHPELSKYKWINYKKLVSFFLHPKDKLEAVYYFTARITWDSEKEKRHFRLMNALLGENVTIIPGLFQEVTKKCRACNEHYDTHEEKRTDVNIAVRLIRHAIEDRYDKAIIFSGDSDLIPAIETVNKLAPRKRIEAVIPIHMNAHDIRESVFRASQISEKHLLDAQFDDEVKGPIKHGQAPIIKKPDAWR